MESVKIAFGTKIDIAGDIYVFNPSGNGKIISLKLLSIANTFTVDIVKELTFSTLREYFLAKGIRIHL
jgi:hypothetical protein